VDHGLTSTRSPAGTPTAGSSSSSAFIGGGNTLGSDEVPSVFIPDPEAPQGNEEEEEVAVRNITFWREGFSVEDGPLMRYDDPANQNLLNEINTGHAPPSILNVRVGQPVELRVARRITEDYQAPPPRPAGPFAGSGNRLGSPAPAVAPAATPVPPIPGAFPTPNDPTAAATAAAIRPMFEVNSSQPTTSIQVRLADGSRMVSRMNLTHTVGDIRSFITASGNAAGRAFTIQTTFPNRVLDDDSLTIEKAGLANSVIVQRWA